MKVVCNVSVHIIVFIPPLYVYSQINIIVINVVIKKGIPNWLNNNYCKTNATRYNLTEAPNKRDKKKQLAPHLFE
jgi:hypothetical protein